MNRERLFKALAEIVIYADLEEMPWKATSNAYGEDNVKYWIEQAQDDWQELGGMMRVVEMLLRLANGHALPKHVGLKDELAIVYEELGIDPKNIGTYEP